MEVAALQDRSGLVGRQQQPTVVSTIVIPAFRPKPTSTSPADSQQASGTSEGPNEIPPDWGGNPTIQPDIALTACFLLLFLAGGAYHGWRYYSTTRAKDASRRKPTLSGLMVGFCLLRTVACALRLGWAAHPSVGTGIAGSILLNIGSVAVMMVNLMLGQRIVRYFSLKSLSNSRWRFIMFWSSPALLVLGILSSIAIVALYSVGASLITLRITPGSVATMQLIQASVSWLLALGVFPMFFVLVVVVTAGNLPDQCDMLGRRHGVFFLAGSILVIGQALHLAAIALADMVGDEMWLGFFAAALALDVIVVWLYALASLDKLFSEPSPVAATKMSGIVHNNSNSNNTTNEAAENKILVRKSYKIEIDQVDGGPVPSPSPDLSGPDRETPPMEYRQQQVISPPPLEENTSSWPLASQPAMVPHHPLDMGESRRGGIRRLQAELDQSDRWMYMPEDQRDLY